MATKTAAKQTCAHCGAKQPRSRLVFSKFSRSYYCVDERACNARAKRAKRVAA